MGAESTISVSNPLVFGSALRKAVVPMTLLSYRVLDSSDQSHRTRWLRRPLKKISLAAEKMLSRESLSSSSSALIRGLMMLRRMRSCLESGNLRRKLAMCARTLSAAMSSSNNSVPPPGPAGVGSARIEWPDAVLSMAHELDSGDRECC